MSAYAKTSNLGWKRRREILYGKQGDTCICISIQILDLYVWMMLSDAMNTLAKRLDFAGPYE